MAVRNVYTLEELKSIRRRVRITLADGRRLGPKNVQPSRHGMVEAILIDMPEGLVVTDIFIDHIPLALEGMPFTTSGGNLRITFTPASLGLVPVDASTLRAVN